MSTSTAPGPRLLKFDSKAAWLHARRTMITASEAGKILGLSPFGGPLSVWAEKMAPPVADDRASGASLLRRGIRMEGYLLDEFEEATGSTLLRPNPSEPWLVVHPTIDWLAATPDAIAIDDAGNWLAVVEAKSAGQGGADGFGDDGTDEVPLSYMTQVALQRACCDLPQAFLIAAVKHMDDVRIFTLPRNEKLESNIIARVAEWRERHLIRGEQPAFDGSDGGDAILRALHPKDTRPVLLTADTEAADWLKALVERRSTFEKAESEVAEATQRVKALIGDAAGIESPLVRVTWKATKDKESIGWQAVAADLARVLGDHVGVPEAQRLAHSAVATNTFTKPGSRVFLVRPRS